MQPIPAQPQVFDHHRSPLWLSPTRAVRVCCPAHWWTEVAPAPRLQVVTR